jgi:type II secretory pathway pseudopilin PulG
MKNRKGFVLLESVIVLVVVALALTGFMTTYTVLSNKSKQKEHFDKTSDKYLLYTISSLGTSGNNDFITCANNAENSSKNIVINVSRNNAYSNQCLKDIYQTSSDPSLDKGEQQLKDVFDTTGLVYLYYIKDISTALKATGDSKPTKLFDNGTIEYIKTLDVNKSNYLIGVFRKSDKYYYASINL